MEIISVGQRTTTGGEMNELIKKIESCDFQCEAGPLVNSRDWQRLTAINAELLEALEQIVAGNSTGTHAIAKAAIAKGEK